MNFSTKKNFEKHQTNTDPLYPNPNKNIYNEKLYFTKRKRLLNNFVAVSIEFQKLSRNIRQCIVRLKIYSCVILYLHTDHTIICSSFSVVILTLFIKVQPITSKAFAYQINKFAFYIVWQNSVKRHAIWSIAVSKYRGRRQLRTCNLCPRYIYLKMPIYMLKRRKVYTLLQNTLTHNTIVVIELFFLPHMLHSGEFYLTIAFHSWFYACGFIDLSLMCVLR